MGILQRILTALGLRESDRAERSAGAAARVERERTGGAEEAADAGDEPGSHSPAADADAEPAAAGTDAAGSTGSLVDTDEGVEPAEAAGPGESEPTGADVVAEEHVDDPVETVKGIGPAYADRLGDAGVATVGELAVADAASLSEATGISEKRIGRWIERARAR